MTESAAQFQVQVPQCEFQVQSSESPGARPGPPRRLPTVTVNVRFRAIQVRPYRTQNPGPGRRTSAQARLELGSSLAAGPGSLRQQAVAARPAHSVGLGAASDSEAAPRLGSFKLSVTSPSPAVRRLKVTGRPSQAPGLGLGVRQAASARPPPGRRSGPPGGGDHMPAGPGPASESVARVRPPIPTGTARQSRWHWGWSP